MRAIKISVIVMGVALVAGMVVLVATLITRASRLGEAEAPPTESVLQPLALGPGDRIASATLDGVRALLVVDRSAGHQDVLVVDTRTGLVTLTLSGAAAP
ncbi:MAG: hypothetical protein ACFCVH_17900 [Alphaproteobacteria bacterium]